MLMWLLQADELKAKIEVLKSASLEVTEQFEGLQEEAGRLRADLADRVAALDQAQTDAAQASQQAQCSAAHAASMQEECGRLQAELAAKAADFEQARPSLYRKEFCLFGVNPCMALRTVPLF